MTTEEGMFARGILGLRDASQLAGRSLGSFQRLARLGRLPFRAVIGGRWGRYWLVDQGSFEDWLRSHEEIVS